MELSDYTEIEFEAALTFNIRTLTKERTPVSNPLAYVLGGQSGAGKSTLQEYLFQQHPNTIIVDGDTFRQQHPHFDELVEKYGKDAMKYTSQFSGRMTDELVDYFSQAAYNLIVEGTLRTFEVPYDSAKQFKEAGYQVELYVMAVKPELSYLSTLLRYEQMAAINPQTARHTPKSHHDAIIEQMPENLDRLQRSQIFSEIVLMDRAMNIVYAQSRNPEQTASKALIEIWMGLWADEELEMFQAVLDQTVELIHQHPSSEKAEEIQELQQLLEKVEKQAEQRRALDIERRNKLPFKEKLERAKAQQDELLKNKSERNQNLDQNLHL
ncbi:zeta toxin family protein [Lactococcus lactis]|uniref:zeta toxin family protein n=1 Tax=Lactococcus lactis TaxID=1358 RepID=UPI0018C5359A|nr:zeta toxin family protein [Lactococcus lactis]MBG1278050.1 AAA family ATPase [Lactococcus lactis subsp. lactis]